MTTPSTEYRLIALTNGQFCKVDASDFDWLSQWKWRAWQCPTVRGRYYAVRSYYAGNYKSIFVPMAREIMGLKYKQGFQVDHINRDTLDNRRRNLRICSQAQNQANRPAQKNNKSGYKGVWWVRKKKKWESRITVNKKRIRLGYFDDAKMAHEAYKNATIKYNKDFARF